MAYDQPEPARQIADNRPPPSARKLQILTALYDGEIRDVDASLGRFLDALRADGVLDETLVVVTADHGENLGDHGMMSHIASLHRSVRHVPLLIRHPGHFEGGVEVTETVRLEDLFPTILESCGLPVPEDLDGESIRRSLKGRRSRALHGPFKLPRTPGRQAEASAQPTEDTLSPSLRAVFDGRLHLIVGSDGGEELYDVGADPDEKLNRAAEGAPEALRRELP